MLTFGYSHTVPTEWSRPAGVLSVHVWIARFSVPVLVLRISTRRLQYSGLGFDSPFFGLIRSPVHRNEALRAETSIPPEFQSELADWPKIRQFMQEKSNPSPAVAFSHFGVFRDELGPRRF